MTSDNFPTRLAIKQPFASGDGAELTEIDDASGTSVNYVDGFPSVYGAPASNGGKYVTRGEMNAIGNLASRNDFYRMCGGVNKFDPSFATKIGGYAKGAVLDVKLSSGAVRRVMSYVDNNMIDFTGGTDTSLYPDITNGSVDNVNWVYCDVDSEFDDYIFSAQITNSGNTILGYFMSDFDGMANVVVPSYTITKYDTYELQLSQSSQSDAMDTGFSIGLYDLGTSMPSTAISKFPEWSATVSSSYNKITWNNNDWMIIHNTRVVGTVYYSNYVAYTNNYPPSMSMAPLVKGHYYCVAICGSGNINTYLGAFPGSDGYKTWTWAINTVTFSTTPLKIYRA